MCLAKEQTIHRERESCSRGALLMLYRAYEVVHGTHPFLAIEYQKERAFAIRETHEKRPLFLGKTQKSGRLS